MKNQKYGGGGELFSKSKTWDCPKITILFLIQGWIQAYLEANVTSGPWLAIVEYFDKHLNAQVLINNESFLHLGLVLSSTKDISYC